MLSLRRTLLLLSAVSGLSAYTNRASACGETPCAVPEEVTPQYEYAPLNTEIRVLYFGTLEAYAGAITCELDLTRIRLVPGDGGEAIELQGTLHEGHAERTWLVARPLAPLAPDMYYEVQMRLGRGDACGCEEREWSALTNFNTRGGEDHEAPEFAGVPALTYGERVTYNSDCGAVNVVPALPGAGFEDARDEYTGVRTTCTSTAGWRNASCSTWTIPRGGRSSWSTAGRNP